MTVFIGFILLTLATLICATVFLIIAAIILYVSWWVSGFIYYLMSSIVGVEAAGYQTGIAKVASVWIRGFVLFPVTLILASIIGFSPLMYAGVLTYSAFVALIRLF